MDNYLPEPPPLDEPSVLDYLKAKLRFWQPQEISLPLTPKSDSPASSLSADAPFTDEPVTSTVVDDTRQMVVNSSPMSVTLVMILAMLGQAMFQGKQATVGILLYIIAISLAIWAYQKNQLGLAPLRMEQSSQDTFTVRQRPLFIGLGFSLAAFLAFGGNQFDSFNLLLLTVGVGCLLWAAWPLSSSPDSPDHWWSNLRQSFTQSNLQLNINTRYLVWLAVFAVAAFFRAYHLGQVVPEMVSDHAEKLLDVYDVLQGDTKIFFPRNTGREALQMYLTAAVAKVFGTGVSFLSLKIGTVVAGIFMLPYMYLLGKEFGNRRVGLFAMFLIGIATWPNVLARVALRFILYPALTAPLLFHLLRGLRKGDRRHFIWAGVFLGVGLHGYTPYRIVPVLVLLACGLYWLHPHSRQQKKQVMYGLALVVLISVVLFLPLARYWLEDPQMFVYRAFSRVGGVERNLSGSAWLILLSNLWNGLRMFNWDSGNIWVVSIPHTPILGIVSGAFFLLGIALLLVRYIQQRDWRDLFLLLAVPVLLLPSILSLAFPDENPAPNRGGGSMVVVFLIAALALDALLRGLHRPEERNFRLQGATLIGAGLMLFALGNNYMVTFQQYQQQYENGAWNTSEMGHVIANFSHAVDDPDHAWVVAYPHWVDNRLVGINAGFPTKNYEIWPEKIAETMEVAPPKLFLFRPDDTQAAEVLEQTYPNGQLSLYQSERANKDFYTFYVPAGE